VEAGEGFSVALGSDGTLWSWGSDGQGVAGVGSASGDTLVPTQVGTDRDWVSVSAGDRQGVAGKSEGTLWAWGWNGTGGAGGDEVCAWVSVSAGVGHGVAVRSDGTLWSWGWNDAGRTGLGSSSGVTLVPTQVGTDSDWVSVSAGNLQSLAVKSDGTLWSWG